MKRNMPLLKKLISRFKGTIKKSATVDSESIKYLKKLVNRFEKALDNANGGVKISQIGNDDEEREETADSSQQSADSETNIRFSKNKEEYPYSMQTVIKEYIDSVDEKILKAAENLRENKNDSFVRQKICDVDSDFIAEVKDIFDLNVDIFTVNINSNAFNHIEKRHGLNGEADKSMANLKDLARIGYVIQNRDSLEPLYLNDKQVYSIEFFENKNVATSVTIPANSKAHVQLDVTADNSITEKTQKDNSFDENNSKNVSDERKSVKRSYEPEGESSKKYSYDEVVNKNGLTIIGLSDTVPLKNDGSIDRGIIINEARKNAKSKNNPNNTDKETFVYVPDIAKNVRINRAGLEYGLSHGAEDTAIATMNIADLLESSFAINELNGRTTNKKQTEMSYVLFAVGKNKKGSYLVRIKIDKDMNAISEISACGLAAIRAKENGALFLLNSNEGEGDKTPVPYLGSTISIADLLHNVKNLNLANEVFSDDVAKELGVAKSKGDLSKDLRYSKQRSYNPFEDVDEGNKWVEGEDENGVKILFSVPDFDNPAYEHNHAPDEEPEIIETYKAVASSSTESDITGYLKTHLHNINLDHIKGEIKAKYDKNTSVYAMWARKEGTRGVTADQIKQELEEIIPGK